jgi:hypothetical protein
MISAVKDRIRWSVREVTVENQKIESSKIPEP